MLPRRQLTAWIEDLRGRLERGELADVGPVLIEPFYEVPDLERWVRFTSREVDRWQATDDSITQMPTTKPRQTILAPAQIP